MRLVMFVLHRSASAGSLDWVDCVRVLPWFGIGGRDVNVMQSWNPSVMGERSLPGRFTGSTFSDWTWIPGLHQDCKVDWGLCCNCVRIVAGYGCFPWSPGNPDMMTQFLWKSKDCLRVTSIEAGLLRITMDCRSFAIPYLVPSILPLILPHGLQWDCAWICNWDTIDGLVIWGCAVQTRCNDRQKHAVFYVNMD